MKIGMIGLGRMGANMVRRLMEGGHQCAVFDLKRESVMALAKEGAAAADSIEDLVKKCGSPAAVWIMVPAGEATEKTVMATADRMKPGDIIVDGGNSRYKDDIRRAKLLDGKGIRYLDVGTSGGIWGRERGYCLMIGGPADAVKELEPIFRTLAPGRGAIPAVSESRSGSTAAQGFLHCGSSGAGHFVKMVHNGIEYGLMQSYAEGFDIMHAAASGELPKEQRLELNMADIAEVWRRGSVISSWLLDLTAMALAEDPTLSKFSGWVQDSGEGRWTVMAAIEEAVPCEVLSAALYTRFRSRQEHTFAEKLLSAMRFKFGGHVERPAGG